MTSSYWNPTESTYSDPNWSQSFTFPTPPSWESPIREIPTTFPSNFPSPGSSWEFPSTLPAATAAPESKPFDWGAAIAASKDLMGGVANLIAGIRGVPPGYGGYQMAGSNLSDYLKSKEEDAYLKDLLSKLRKEDSTELELEPLKTSDFLRSFGVG